MADGTYRILGGEHRYHAAKVLGWTKIQAVVLTGSQWEDEDLQKFVTMRLNVLRGKLNPDRMVKLYDEMSIKYGVEALQGMFAYVDNEAWTKTVKAIGRGITQGLPKGIADKFDKAKPEIKTVEDLSKTLNNIFSNYGSTLDQNFLVFTYGGREHYHIQLDEPTRAAIKKIFSRCEAESLDVLSVLRGPLEASAAFTEVIRGGSKSGSSEADLDD